MPERRARQRSMVVRATVSENAVREIDKLIGWLGTNRAKVVRFLLIRALDERMRATSRAVDEALRRHGDGRAPR